MMSTYWITAVMLGASSEVENLHEWGRACGDVIGKRTLLRYCTVEYLET